MKKYYDIDDFNQIVAKYSPQYDAAVKACKPDGVPSGEEKRYQLAVTVFGPVLFRFTEWLLDDAQKRGIQRLYFMARDSYAVYQIALQYCERYGIDIECRYLYCSRYALRVPEYQFNIDEAIGRICQFGTAVTLDSIFERSGMGRSLSKHFEEKLGLAEFGGRILTKDDLFRIGEILGNSLEYRQCLENISSAAFGHTAAYLKQEGLLDQIKYALADSGWTGSIQRGLQRILRYVGNPARELFGYYFGLFRIPGDMKPENYKCYYFSEFTGYRKKIFFNNNLIECMAASTDSMTTGYYFHSAENRYSAVFEPEKNRNAAMLKIQLKGIRDFTAEMMKYRNGSSCQEINADQMVEELLKGFMIYPDAEIADCMGCFQFSDDLSENRVMKLAEELNLDEIKTNFLLESAFGHLKKRQNLKKRGFWLEGSAARLPDKERTYCLRHLLLYKALYYLAK